MLRCQVDIYNFLTPATEMAPRQRHFALAQYPEIAEYSLYPTAESASPAYTVSEPRCFITSCLLLSSEKMVWLTSSALIWAPSLVLWFEKRDRRKNSDWALVLWFYESEIYSPDDLLEDWLKMTSLWTLFQTRGVGITIILLHISQCERGNSIYLSATEKMRDVGGLHLRSSSHRFSLYISTQHMTILCCLRRLKTGPTSLWTSSLTKGEQQKWPYSCAAGSWSTNSIFQLKWLSVSWYFPTHQVCCWCKNVRMAKQRKSEGPSIQGIIVCGQQQTIKKKIRWNWIYRQWSLFCRKKCQNPCGQTAYANIQNSAFDKILLKFSFIRCHFRKREKKWNVSLIIM